MKKQLIKTVLILFFPFFAYGQIVFCDFKGKSINQVKLLMKTEDVFISDISTNTDTDRKIKRVSMNVRDSATGSYYFYFVNDAVYRVHFKAHEGEYPFIKEDFKRDLKFMPFDIKPCFPDSSITYIGERDIYARSKNPQKANTIRIKTFFQSNEVELSVVDIWFDNP